jgi:UDP-GlcNAc:undecaprenyl-phosphate/decaprenyl-phosphate GlcNAc-1-phosphate transferase
MVLGFFLVVSALLFVHGHNPQSLDLGFPIILLGVPLADTLKVMVIRAWNGKSIFYADRNHIHHIISAHHITQKATVLIIEIFAILFITLSLVYLYADKFTAYILFCISVVIIFLIKPLLKKVREFGRSGVPAKEQEQWNVGTME